MAWQRLNRTVIVMDPKAMKRYEEMILRQFAGRDPDSCTKAVAQVLKRHRHA